MNETCCKQCTKAGRDSYSARAQWHGEEAVRYANLAVRFAWVAVAGAVFAVVAQIVNVLWL